MLDLDKLSRVHMSLLGEPPEDDHRTLYQAVPAAHGFLVTDVPNLRQFEAVTVLGLALTYPFDGKTMHQTLFLVPALVEDWAVTALEGIAKRIFGRIKDDANLKAANFMRRAFEHLLLGTPACDAEEQPGRWVAFGFKKEDLVPEWLRNGLLAV